MEQMDLDFTLHGMLQEAARKHGGRPALSLDDLTLSFAELTHRASRVAAGLYARGVRPGDRVAVIARNVPDYYALVFASSELGAVLVGLNWRLSARELSVIVADARPRLLIAAAEFAANVAPTAAEVGAEMLDLDRDVAELAAFDGPAVPGREHASDEVVVQLYSSGTTGRPKGILLTHANFSPSAESGRRLYEMSETSVNLLVSPLFHIGGLGYSMTCLSLGGHTVLVREASAAHLAGEIERRGVTHSFQVPSVIQALIDLPDISAHDLSSLEVIAYGGSPMSPALLSRAREVLDCAFIAVYGMTETAGTVIALRPESIDSDRAEEMLKSIGKPLPWMGEAVVADLTTGEPCPPGRVGEIRVRSVQVTPGYWNRPEATEEALLAGGWLCTGDAAYVDEDGFFFLHDRIKDMIISGGENVFPAEVEAVILELPAVAGCAVIGVPSARWGETVKAFVVPRRGETISADEVIAYCRANLAHYKCPAIVEVVGELPYNASGKILKGELRKQSAAGSLASA